MQAYQDAFNHTSTSWAPWHVIPADNKWFTRLAVAAIITAKFKEIDQRYPMVGKERKKEMFLAKKMLEEEK